MADTLLPTYSSIFGGRNVRGIQNARGIIVKGKGLMNEVKVGHNLGKHITGILNPSNKQFTVVRKDTQSITISGINENEEVELIIY